jgi:hypothetical protein
MVKVTVVHNSTKVLPKKLQKYAFGQDANGDIVDDAIVGKAYQVYGYRELGDQVFYLVTKSAPNWLWWMPSQLYDVQPDEVKRQLPTHWVEGVDQPEGKVGDWSHDERDVIIAPQLYHDNSLEIEDYTGHGQAVAKKIIESEKE